MIIFQIFLNKKFILKKITGIDNDEISSLQEDGVTFLEELSKKNYNAAAEIGKRNVSTIVAWFTWLSFRLWSTRVIFSLVVALATVVGTALLVQQNKLIQNQNLLIELETRPFVWASIVFSKIGDTKTQSFNQITINTLNSPARIEKINLEYMINSNSEKKIISLDTFNNLILFPDEDEYYTITSNDLLKSEVLKLSKEQQFERNLHIEYSWLYDKEYGKRYYFEITWRFDKRLESWLTTYQNSN